MNDPAATFELSRESRIRIDGDGHVWHEGERIERPRLERALASWIDYDDASGRYVMRNAINWCFVTVDVTPLVVRHAWVRGEDVEVELSDESREPLALDTLRVDADGVVYAYVRGATLLARFSRAAAFALLEHAELLDGAATLRFGDHRVALTQIAAGEQPPPRPPGYVATTIPSTASRDGGTAAGTP